MKFIKKHYKGISYIFYSFCIAFGVASHLFIIFQYGIGLTNIDIFHMALLTLINVAILIISIFGIIFINKDYSRNAIYNVNNFIVILIAMLGFIEKIAIGIFDAIAIISIIISVITFIIASINVFIVNDKYPFMKLILSCLAIILLVFVTCFTLLDLQDDIFNFIRGICNLVISIFILFPVLGLSSIESSTH